MRNLTTSDARRVCEACRRADRRDIMIALAASTGPVRSLGATLRMMPTGSPNALWIKGQGPAPAGSTQRTPGATPRPLMEETCLLRSPRWGPMRPRRPRVADSGIEFFLVDHKELHNQAHTEGDVGLEGLMYSVNLNAFGGTAHMKVNPTQKPRGVAVPTRSNLVGLPVRSL